MSILEKHGLKLNEEMNLSGDRVAVGVTDEDGRKYYIIYLGVGAQTTSKEHAKTMLMDALEKRHDMLESRTKKPKKPKKVKKNS